MPTTINGSPSPKAHIKTLMKIGYDFCTAAADIIDNSIAAKCSSVHIFSPPGMPSPYITIVDDGYGMDQEELLRNMIIGCKDPSEDRSESDLGRFGSGMKTASFSQAKRLIVLSKKLDEPIVGACWDIDRIINENIWCLERLDGPDLLELYNEGMVHLGDHGTQIIWQNLTCFQQDSHSLNYDVQIAAKLTAADKHIGLHFHRFMTGANKISFFINKRPIQAIDPFMSMNSGYQEGRKEKFRCKGGYIEIQTHVLPSFNRIGKVELEMHGGAAEIAQKQGLYIYRNKRLINAGGWLDLSKHHQLSALARVQIDIPSTLDDEWSTDVKKATLQLPPRVKRDLKKYLSDPISRSKKVHTNKGKLEEANVFWKICNNEDENTITYEIHPENENLVGLINKAHPNLRPTLAAYLMNLSRELPLQHIYSTLANRPLDLDQQGVESLDIVAILQSYKENISG
tara:strand:- start:4978 stop:6345 length:1368 start_codon:yes stop_codon:yes gene_type:complete